MSTVIGTHDIDVIPTLPSRSLPATIAFYANLGFEGELIDDNYAILCRGPIELHFFPHPDLNPAECYSGCYVRMNNVDDLHAELMAANLPARGIPRLERVEDKPWGMREFALLDNDGNLIRFGRVI
ncbi:MAG: VOC family protein [Pseudohongiella sp.]|jgi:catechol 2,3-dioxygenase-like lactoylglutathione lyase family enzyme|nr:VOC family protein [Pseudohongiella sp.]MDP2284357.1 VOC family protein [Pseudohongiella sp.]